MKRAVAVLAVVSLLSLASPAQAAEPIAERCRLMTERVNALRTAADLKVAAVLCRVARLRAYAMVTGGFWTHDLDPVKRALTAAGICWRNVAEVIAWRSAWTASATWVGMWWASDKHRPLLASERYDSGGGGYTGGGSRWPANVAVFYVLESC